MIYRVELLCSKKDRDPIMDPDKLCYSHRDEEERPIAERCNLEMAATYARTKARDTGWIFLRTVWLCPACKPQPEPEVVKR